MSSRRLTSRPKSVCGANCAASKVKSSLIDDDTDPLAFTVSCASVDGSSGASSGCSSTMLEICLYMVTHEKCIIVIRLSRCCLLR
jgi:hypothetical protein